MKKKRERRSKVGPSLAAIVKINIASRMAELEAEHIHALLDSPGPPPGPTSNDTLLHRLQARAAEAAKREAKRTAEEWS